MNLINGYDIEVILNMNMNLNMNIIIISLGNESSFLVLSLEEKMDMFVCVSLMQSILRRMRWRRRN